MSNQKVSKGNNDKRTEEKIKRKEIGKQKKIKENKEERKLEYKTSETNRFCNVFLFDIRSCKSQKTVRWTDNKFSTIHEKLYKNYRLFAIIANLTPN